MSLYLYRLCIRFQNLSLLPRLRAVQQEMNELSGKKVSMSQLVETIVEQYLDTNHPETKEG